MALKKGLILAILVVLLTIPTTVTAEYFTINTAVTDSFNGIPFGIMKTSSGSPIPLIQVNPDQVGGPSYNTIDLSGYTATKIHFLQNAAYATEAVQGTKAGKITVYYIDGTTDSLDLIMGVNTAEWSYDRPENQASLAHNKIPTLEAYSWLTNEGSSSSYSGHIFYTSIDTQQKPLDYIELYRYSDVYIPWLGTVGAHLSAITVESSLPQLPVAIIKVTTPEPYVVGYAINLDGSDSYSNPIGNTLTYEWQVTYGSGVIYSSSDAVTTFTPTVDGGYTIQLIVKDGDLISSPTITTLTVKKPVEISFDIKPIFDPLTYFDYTLYWTITNNDVKTVSVIPYAKLSAIDPVDGSQIWFGPFTAKTTRLRPGETKIIPLDITFKACKGKQCACGDVKLISWNAIINQNVKYSFPNDQYMMLGQPWRTYCGPLMK